MKELRIAQSQVKFLDPEFPTDQPDLQTLLALVYEPLLQWDNGCAAPALISSWQVSDSGHSWLLTLRENTYFHDGSPCTVEHIVQSIERHKHSEGPFGMGGVYTPYLEDLIIQPYNKTQVTVTNPRSTGDLVDIFAAIYVSKYIDAEHPPVGTGAYMVEDYVEGKFIKLSLASNKRYENKYLNLEIFEIPDSKDRYDSLLAGQVDLATSLELLLKIPTNDNLIWQSSTNTLSVPCFLNGFDDPFCQPEARLAINLAIDVDSIIHDVWHDLAAPATTVVSPYHFGYPDHLTPHAYDPNRATELLEDCSMPDQLILKTPLVIPERAQQVSKLIQQQLLRIGINIIIDVEEDRPKYARDVSNKKIGHMAMFDSSPLSTYRVLQEKISGHRQGTWWQGVKDNMADQLIKTAHQTLDIRERTKAYNRCLAWLHDNPHWLYLYHPNKLYAYLPEVEGVYLDHAGLVRIE
jgi:peptide/nickel transport system substrate-binding protein